MDNAAERLRAAAAAAAAAAELKPVSRTKYRAYIALAMLVQLLWGLFGVCTRYLQTESTQTIPTMQLTVVVTVVAGAGLVIFIAIPSWVHSLYTANKGRERRAAQDHMMAALMLRSSSTVITSSRLLARPRVLPRTATAAERERERRRALLISYGTAAIIGSLVAFQALTLIYACRFVEAYLVQLVLIFTPLLTAIANRCLLKQPTPVGLWQTLVLAIAGSVMMIMGEWWGDKSSTSNSVSAKDMLIGLALALASMLLLAAYLLMLQVMQNLVTGLQVIWANTYVTILLLTPIALGVEGTDWSWVLKLSPFSWCVLVFAGFFIEALNTIWTQQCSRVLGAAVIALFIALRLVSSLIGSIALLNDVPSSPLAWTGFGVVLVAMTAFFWLQHRAGKRASAEAEAEAEAEGEAKGAEVTVQAAEGEVQAADGEEKC